MTLEEIIKEKDWWYLKDKNYIMDNDWVNEYKQPSPYPAFIWWDDYKFKTPSLYFQIAIREHTGERRRTIESKKNKVFESRYTVIVGGAIGAVPISIETWEYDGSPWKGGMCAYIDCFYFGRKYKELEESYIGKQAGTSSFLIKGFNDLDEAKQFTEMWKIKAIEDHKEYIEIDKEIMNLIEIYKRGINIQEDGQLYIN